MMLPHTVDLPSATEDVYLLTAFTDTLITHICYPFLRLFTFKQHFLALVSTYRLV